MSKWDGEITVLPALEAVRKRAWMYVDMQDRLLPNAILKEVLCCTRDEIALGRCTNITIFLDHDGRAFVKDDGPGLPLDMRRDGVRTAEAYLTQIFACANGKEAAPPETVCTFGLAVANALCSEFNVSVMADGVEWHQSYREGRPLTKFEPVDKTATTGTAFGFTLDRSILPCVEFDYAELVFWTRELVGSRGTLTDYRTGRTHAWVG